MQIHPEYFNYNIDGLSIPAYPYVSAALVVHDMAPPHAAAVVKDWALIWCLVLTVGFSEREPNVCTSNIIPRW